jgi:RNA recognition motif-containing protein
MAASDLSNVFGVDMNVEHPKKLFVRGLSRILTDSEAELRRAELERVFKKYGGSLGVSVTVSKNTTFAFIECESERLANLALTEMSGQYTISKARRARDESSTSNAWKPDESWD